MLEGDNKNIKLEEQKACQERGNSTLGRQDALRGGVASPKDTIPSSLLCMAWALLSLFSTFEVSKPNDRHIGKPMYHYMLVAFHFFLKERVSPKCKGWEMWGMLENLPRRAGEVHH